MASAWKPAKACHDFNNDFTLFTAVPVLFNIYTDKDSNLISEKFIRNRETFKVTNSTQDTVTSDPKEMLGIIDLRSLGYYKIKQGVLQQNLSCMYHLSP